MSVLQPCPKGHYCPEGTGIAKQFPCPIGTYNPRELMDSQSDCLLCPSGHYCPDVGLEEPTGETSVKKKPFSKNSETNAPYSCIKSPVFKCLFVGLCLAGFWCREGSYSRSPMDGSTGAPCPAGHYCPKGDKIKH